MSFCSPDDCLDIQHYQGGSVISVMSLSPQNDPDHTMLGHLKLYLYPVMQLNDIFELKAPEISDDAINYGRLGRASVKINTWSIIKSVILNI